MRKLAIIGAFVVSIAGCSGPSTPPEPAYLPKGTESVNFAPETPLDQTLPELSAALASGDLTSEDLTQAYLDRIEAIDRQGPTLRSVLAVNPDAMDQARASDARRAAGETLGALDGIPVLLKDNIESADPMATTAGALALKDNVTGRDSPLVAGLREQGAVILGKTNLSQWANFRSNESISGWSALGGQVRNPHILDRQACGSSSGSGAAVAASLAAGAVGTETNGSIICPSNVNGIVGFKPTVGLVPQDLIIPISPSQDTAGPMTRTVTGAAMMLSAMAPGDTDYAADLSADALQGRTIGVLRFAAGENPNIQARFEAALADLEAAGATLVEIDSFTPAAENYFADALSLLQYEFKDSLNAYLESTPDTVETRTLADLIAFNRTHADVELVLFDQDLFEASDEKGTLEDEAYIRARDAIQAASRSRGIDALLAESGADILVAPSGPLAPPIDAVNGDIWPSWAGAGYLAAIAGYPHLTVPMGDVRGVPVGLSFIGTAGADEGVLSAGYAYEQQSGARVDPQYLTSADQHPETAAAAAGLVGK